MIVTKWGPRLIAKFVYDTYTELVFMGFISQSITGGAHIVAEDSEVEKPG